LTPFLQGTGIRLLLRLVFAMLVPNARTLLQRPQIWLPLRDIYHGVGVEFGEVPGALVETKRLGFGIRLPELAPKSIRCACRQNNGPMHFCDIAMVMVDNTRQGPWPQRTFKLIGSSR